eukprot:CAMPEP_0173226186 /NCGR_PEP_ID=MMETSP1142-20121109/5304_1 /TAXON_ID=483371 /ORGANISM="non described non described, Strain CCMP2298" /LENGTH=122 /DNA_ID=CAMNT_0014154635 /DNA_START=678 /DNA_END=1046 /DNA_ORIENTATION=-
MRGVHDMHSPNFCLLASLLAAQNHVTGFAHGDSPGNLSCERGDAFQETWPASPSISLRGVCLERRGARRRDSPAQLSRYATIPPVPSLRRHCSVTTYLLPFRKTPDNPSGIPPLAVCLISTK